MKAPTFVIKQKNTHRQRTIYNSSIQISKCKTFTFSIRKNRWL